ncbi:VanZ family protein [[Clostridium] symbiosum]
MPLGFLLPLIWDKIDRWKCIISIGFLFSLFIEISQLSITDVQMLMI